MTPTFKPILFSSPMVQAILRDEKIQTRRIIEPQPPSTVTDIISNCSEWVSAYPNMTAIKPFEFTTKCKYSVGDILWVRETFLKCEDGFIYRADHYGSNILTSENGKTFDESVKWKPSIFMPKEACRIFLKLKSIRIQRLQNISEADAIAEGIESRLFQLPDDTETTGYKIYGVENSWDENPVISYQSLWQKIHGEKSWNENPWVWVYEFENTDIHF